MIKKACKKYFYLKGVENENDLSYFFLFENKKSHFFPVLTKNVLTSDLEFFIILFREKKSSLRRRAPENLNFLKRG